MYGETTTYSTTRTVGWHVMDIKIGTNTIEYRMDGNLMGIVGKAPSRNIDTLTFDISNAGNYGENSLLIDNLSITTVPEPSTFILGGIAAFGCLRRKRS